MTHKDTAEHRVEVRLTKMQYKILKILGGASAVLKQVIDEKAGDKNKLLSLRTEKQKEIQDIDQHIKEYDERAAEELKQKQSKWQEEGLKLKHKIKPQSYILICPKCNGRNVLTNKNSIERKCSHCGFIIKKDNFIFELDYEIQKELMR